MGQKVNPRGFRIGLNDIWRGENQSYGKSFKNIKRLYKEIKNTSNFLNQYFESKNLVQGESKLKIEDNHWKYDLQYVPMFPKTIIDTYSVSKKTARIFSLDARIRSYNATFWYQNGRLLCEFIKISLKKGTAFRKITNIIDRLFAEKRSHQIVLKAVSGNKNLKFTGLKIRYAGRFGGNRSRMANSLVHRIGAISLQKVETYVEFYESPLYTKQGICNLQIWMAYKII
uniref:Ribosomal protein S3 n=1 Tax=Bangia fuscopurpurea TaxID=101920 RepID=A0A0E3M3Y2_BANFU|nr:ribosomal protein S3 [Bangia fuscopurpurea]AKA66476.1 ribosomal protein S3 [Bangia fuscopurpurea]